MARRSGKVREFPVVLVVGVEEGISRGVRAIGEAEAVEEERRMLYVAMTRARKRLTLTYVAGTKEEPGFLSRFLTDLVRQPVLQ